MAGMQLSFHFPVDNADANSVVHPTRAFLSGKHAHGPELQAGHDWISIPGIDMPFREQQQRFLLTATQRLRLGRSDRLGKCFNNCSSVVVIGILNIYFCNGGCMSIRM